MKTKYWVAFSAIDQLSSTFIQRLYNYFGDIEVAWYSTKRDLEQIDGLSIKKAENFLAKRTKIDVEKAYEEILKRNINIITFDDKNYPYMLSQISNPPMTLYYKGNLSDCNLERTIAFVGSRKASLNGKDSVSRIIRDFKNTDVCIVSGLASGIDTISHQAALSNNLKTIGVIASGLDFTYPSVNKHLYEQIANGMGAVITEYYPTFEPLKFRFPERNRIVTGLSYGTVVGEAALKSGALISANLTLEQGRELMCIPGSINNVNTEGIYKLIKDGASIVTSGEDILNCLNWQFRVNAGDNEGINSNGNNVTNELSLTEKKIFDIISVEPKCFDELQVLVNIDADELLTTLTVMEMNGLIEGIEGDRYKRV